jgi:hypothetical protein
MNKLHRVLIPYRNQYLVIPTYLKILLILSWYFDKTITLIEIGSVLNMTQFCFHPTALIYFSINIPYM